MIPNCKIFAREETFKLVDVALVLTKLVKKALVEVSDVPLALAKLKRPEVFKFVPVALVKVVRPMLVIPETKRFVEVTLVEVTLVKLVFVVKVIAPLENCINGVPVTTVAEE